jgi:hypothetical protein
MSKGGALLPGPLVMPQALTRSKEYLCLLSGSVFEDWASGRACKAGHSATSRALATFMPLTSFTRLLNNNRCRTESILSCHLPIGAWFSFPPLIPLFPGKAALHRRRWNGPCIGFWVLVTDFLGLEMERLTFTFVSDCT